VLQRISKRLDGESKEDLSELSSEFYTVIPHDFGFTKMQSHVIKTKDELKNKIEMVEALAEIEIATKLLKQNSDIKVNPIDQNYEKLKCEMIPISEDDDEYKIIDKYVHNTHGHTHANFGLSISKLFKISRQNEDKLFDEFRDDPNRQLLWHGSRLTNWTGILSQGLRIAPPEAPVTGYMFGKGVYFADMVSKSANYCFAHLSNQVGVLALCEVALGDMNEKLQSDYYANNLPKGKLSTKGCGRTVPNESESVYLDDGVKVPCGKESQSPNLSTVLQYNEYIVYNTRQVRLRYLVQLRFNNKR